ncbi:MAG: metallophosphoesterase [Clostridia bacterium]|nr:metallophosphoesterase [Clostridia bacterium]
MIYFTADLHLNHSGIIQMCGRPFANVEEMNHTLIANINARVKQHDTLYILGDVAHKGTVKEANRLIAQINGKKILLRGNHDRHYDECLFADVSDFLEVNFDGQHFALFHYLIEEWPRMWHGSIHLHGHQHNKPEHNEAMRKQGLLHYDVGVDANYYCPVSLLEILAFFGME